ncbi:hypothetical protein C8R46DRAFT_1210012 [Mycena filopes]|nr:hypothetical protein C8R46DRAFT_1210012 [Mycena filopes]
MSDPATLVVARHSLVPLGSLLGPWLIGLIISAVIFGITCLQVQTILLSTAFLRMFTMSINQVYLYYTKFCHRDTVFLKTFVGVLTAIDLLNLVLMSASYYVTSVDNFGDFAAISQAPWQVLHDFVTGGV